MKHYASLASYVTGSLKALVIGLVFTVFTAPLAQAAIGGDSAFGPGAAFFNAKPVSDTELGKMRGGFALPNGTLVSVGVTFSRRLNNGPAYSQSFNLEQIGGKTGVVNTVKVVEVPNGTGGSSIQLSAEAMPSNLVHGIMNNIQNNFSGVTVDNVTTMSIGIQNAPAMAATVHHNLRFDSRSLLGY